MKSVPFHFIEKSVPVHSVPVLEIIRSSPKYPFRAKKSDKIRSIPFPVHPCLAQSWAALLAGRMGS